MDVAAGQHIEPSDERRLALAFWEKQPSDAPAALELPIDNARSSVQTFHAARVPLVLSLAVSAALKVLSQRAGVTLFATLLAAFKVLLYRYTGQTDIIVGSAIANRKQAELERSISRRTDMVVLRTDLGRNPPFCELLRRVHAVACEAFTRHALPLEQLVERLNLQRDFSRTPFQVMFILQETPLLNSSEVDNQMLPYELALCLHDTSHGLRGTIEYNANLFDAGTIERMAGHLRTLLEGIVVNPEQRLADLSLLTAAERYQLLIDWNDTRVDDSPDQCMHQRFEKQVEQTPDAVALIFDPPTVWGESGSHHLTYRELDRRANQLAQHLKKLGIGPDVLTGICMERSLDLVISLLAILKAGGAYVPLDPAYPPDRIAFMLADTAAPVVLTQQHLLSRLSTSGTQALCLDTGWGIIAQAEEVSPSSGVVPANLAYIIYTSGSTGRPKGVAITHGNAVALLNWAAAIFPPQDLRGVLAATSICFDLSVYELFVPLSQGGTIVLAENALRLPTLLSRDTVTLVNTVPSAMTELALSNGIPNSVGTVNLAGEPLKRKLVQQVYERAQVQSVYNLYGPSEDTTYSTFIKIDRDDPKEPSIGRPISNTQAYILDAQMQLVPVGIIGQLYLGGAGVSRGYLNRPELTAERYVPNPFANTDVTLAAAAGDRLYRTGDLARYRPDGNIEFLGRIDHQVKIRGFRIELGEIEVALGQHPAVREALIVTREGPLGDKLLIAYVISRSGQLLASGNLRRFLKEKLPEYMVPSAFVILDAFPLTPNGKINREALPMPAWTRTQQDEGFVAPRNPIEEVLADIWSQVLNVEHVGVHDNFFELGGHSLLITRIVSRLNQEFHIEISLQTLFEHPTIAGLAHCLASAQERTASLQIALLRAVPRDRPIPLSFSQQQFWFMSQLVPDSPLYNVPTVFHIAGKLDVTVLERCLNEMVRRHEALRTVFEQADDRPIQVTLPFQPIRLEVIDLRPPETECPLQMQSLMRQRARQPFDLRHGPLLRATLFQLADHDYQLLLDIHHIATDGWSTGVIMAELKVLYGAMVKGEAPSLPDLPIQYADFTCWQQQVLRGDALEKHVAYWKSLFADQIPVMALPTDRPRPAAQSHQGAKLVFPISAALLDALAGLGQQHNSSLFMVMLAAFQMLLYHYTGQTDMVVATAMANRSQPELEDLVGAFVNTLPIRADLSGDPTFGELVQRVRQRALEAYAHQDLPIEKIVEALNLERTLSYNPLFQVMFDIQNLNAQPIQLSDLSIGFVEEVDTGTAKSDLIFSLEFPEQGPVIFIEYNTDILDMATVRRMVGHFQTLLEGVVANPGQRLSERLLLTEQERHQLLVEWNTTQSQYPQDVCVHERFEAQVSRAADAVALVFADQALTYGELDRRANQLAHYLQSLGVGPEAFVGVCMERSLEMLIALLGILKAGGAYVPLDPAYPTERLAFMLEDARPSALLTQERLLAHLPEYHAHVVCLDADWMSIARSSETDLTRAVGADNAAYMIYTSGSTGRPKGVMISHRALVQYILGAIDHFVLTPQDRVLQFASISFDAAAEEIYPCLLTGAALVLRTDAMLDSIATFMRACAAEDITLLDLPTAYWHSLAAEVATIDWPPSVRLVIIGGEQARPEWLPAWHTHVPSHVRLINTYGPTEATIVATTCDLAGVGRSNRIDTAIGRPVANVQVYLLNSHLQPVPIGVLGELYIGGGALARGYLNRPELTAEKFIPNPFRGESGADTSGEDLRLYKTGDLARYLPDGNIEFLGRVDHQVKIRGFRIELGEIEAALKQHPKVREAVVVARSADRGRSDKQLAAYIVARTSEPLDTRELRDWLKEKLPAYTLPAAFVMLQSLPLTLSGKIDRRALPAPDWNTASARKTCVLPRTPIEQALASIWIEVLGIKQISIHDNFFELGGHSLLAAQIAARLGHFFGHELTVRLLFEAPTIAVLAERIEAAIRSVAEEPPPPIKHVSTDGPVPLSFGQQQLWLIDQLTQGSVAYNSPFPLRIVGSLDKAALQASLTEIMRRHQVLRTTFVAIEGQPFQVTNSTDVGCLPVIDLCHLSETEREAEAQRLALAEARRPFDLSNGPLVRAVLIQLAQNEHVLLLTLHHIVFDGWSLGILFDELGTLYKAFSTHQPSPLPELAIQYADFACWQRQWLQGAELERRLAYWKQQLQGAPAIVSFPLDRSRPPHYSFRGAQHPLSLSRALRHQLHALSRQAGATLFMTLLAALKALICRYTEQTDIVIGTVVANRNRPEIEGLVGYFINVLALRTELRGNWTFRELLGHVRETALGAYAHQELPFDKLVEVLQPKRNLSYNPFFQVMLILQNTSTAPLTLPGLSVTATTIDPGTTQFVDMNLVLEETEQGLGGFIEYNTDLFDIATIQQIQTDYQALLESVSADPNQVISTLLPRVSVRSHAFAVDTLPTQAAVGAQDELALQKVKLLDRRTRLTAEKQSILEKRLRGA